MTLSNNRHIGQSILEYGDYKLLCVFSIGNKVNFICTVIENTGNIICSFSYKEGIVVCSDPNFDYNAILLSILINVYQKEI